MMNNLIFDNKNDKFKIFYQVENFLNQLNLRIVKKELTKPWGGFFVIDEQDAGLFIQLFYPNFENKIFELSNKISPKILIVAPNKRLSWQYHFRRAEIWKLIAGEAKIIVSNNDDETAEQFMKLEQIITLYQGERHRLIGTNNYGVIAEIWQHINAENPSDEDDIVRLQDDFGR